MLQNKYISDSVEYALALQVISWLARKAVGFMIITHNLTRCEVVTEFGQPVVEIDIEQVASRGLKVEHCLRSS
jgi:hypothetical protein